MENNNHVNIKTVSDHRLAQNLASIVILILFKDFWIFMQKIEKQKQKLNFL